MKKSKEPINIAKLFRELRNTQDLSVTQLATKLEIPHPRISEIESGKRFPSASIYQKYHNYFGVSYEYLYGETTEKTSANIKRPLN